MIHAPSRPILTGLFCSSFLAILASCDQAEFTASGTDKPGVCLSGSEYVGANFIFMVDNSGSMRTTDCPSGDQNDCGKTQRETSILSAFDVLAAASTASDYSDQSISSLSIAQFTPEKLDLSIDEFDTRQLTVTSFSEDRSLLASSLEFTRIPEGDTPYLNALNIGERIIKSGNMLEGKDNILVLVTDGDATDQSPSAVRLKADELDAQIITIRVSPQGWDANKRFEQHFDTISRHYRTRATDSYASLEEYTRDLMSLADDISDKPVININSADELEKSIFEEIITKNVACLPQNEG